MRHALRYLGGAVALAAAMYWFDPTSGRRRRARAHDQLLSAAMRMQDGLRVTGRDLSHRLHGVIATLCHSLGAENVDDDILVERVRSRLGRAVSHPGAIEVKAINGQVTLSGPILMNEYDRLLRAVRSVRGVRDLDDRLLLHDTATGVSALQGGRPRLHRFELMQENWSPAARLLTGIGGGALLFYGLRARGVSGYLSAATGGALLLRSSTNISFKRLAQTASSRASAMRTTVYERLRDYLQQSREARAAMAARYRNVASATAPNTQTPHPIH